MPSCWAPSARRRPRPRTTMGCAWSCWRPRGRPFRSGCRARTAGRSARGPTAWARSLVAKGPLALRLGKEAVVRALDLPLADGIRLEHDLYVLLQTTADRRAGIEAFLARRKPRFGGR